MPRAIISKTCLEAIRASTGDFGDDASIVVDAAHVSVELDDSTLKRIDSHTHRGETLSDTLLRMMSTIKGQIQ